MERDAESHSSAKEIDRICDAFETAWGSDTRPSISDFVRQAADGQRSKLFYELLLVDLECRRKAGEHATREEYLRSYPNFSSQIEGVNFHYGDSAFAPESSGQKDPTPATGPQIGALVDHFQLIQQLGSGAMGEVWKAWDTRLRRAVAIKLPRANLLSEGELRRFLREGQAASQLKHPQLASVHDIGRWQGSPYIVVEYVEGENLRQYLDCHRLTFQAMAEICADVAEALHHAHERDIVHRDLKPANIIMDPHGRAHVIDFGLAKWSTEDRNVTIHGELLGTPAYMSPELASGEGASAGPASDIYSLGVILYEMLTGSCPFQGDRSFVLHQILSAEPTAPRRLINKIPHLDKKIPRDLETICLKSLEKEPRRRYTTIQEMAVDLRRFSRGEPILARRAGIAERVWRTARRKPSLVAVAILGLLVVGVAIMAGSLAFKIRALRGYREVALTTEPPGARVAIARLNDRGEVLPNEISQPGGITPLRTDLLPGDYFIEVVWPNGRFHQVLRHVRSASDPPARNDGQKKWLSGAESPETLKKILYPPPDSANDMTEVTADHCELFYVDRTDVTEEQYRKVIGDNNPIDSTLSGAPKKMSYELARVFAESSGKRLPTKREYESLVQNEMPNDEMTMNPEPAPSANSGSDSRTAKPEQKGVDVLRYVAPFTLPSSVRCVRSRQPWFISVK